MLYAIVLARHLGPEGYGYYATGYSLVGISSFFIGIGMDTWYLQQAGIAEDQVRLLAGKILRFKFFLLLLWAPILLVGISFIKPVSIDFLLICILDVWGDNALITLTHGLNVQQRYHEMGRILVLSRFGRLISAIALIGLGFRSPLLFALFRFSFTLLGLFWAAISLKPSFYGLDSILLPIRELIPFGLSDMLAQIYIMIDVSLLALLSGKIEVGLYSPATNLISALFIVPNSLYLYSLPKFSRNLARQSYISNTQIISLLAGFGGMGLILSLGLAASAHWVVALVLGDAFDQTKVLLFFLSPILLYKSIQFGLVVLIVAAGCQKYRLIPQSIAAIANVTLNFWLIPSLGAKGAALVYNISELILLSGYMIVALMCIKRRRRDE